MRTLEGWAVGHNDEWSADGPGNYTSVQIAQPGRDEPIAIVCGGLFADAEIDSIVALITAAPDLLGSLKFILAFYEPGQRHLDTEAWKVAEASARAAVAKALGSANG